MELEMKQRMEPLDRNLNSRTIQNIDDLNDPPVDILDINIVRKNQDNTNPNCNFLTRHVPDGYLEHNEAESSISAFTKEIWRNSTPLEIKDNASVSRFFAVKCTTQ